MLLLAGAALALLTPQINLRAPPPTANAAAYEIERCQGTDTNLESAAGFFVEGFWARGTTTSALSLTPSERARLEAVQTDDMRARYGETVGQRRLDSRFFVATDEAGVIGGCVGVEMALVLPQKGVVLSRAAADGLLTNELNSMGARERNSFRRKSAAELTSMLFPEYQVYGLLANLAVGADARRSGLARKLCDAAEATAAEWDMPAIVLQVEEVNRPARALYGACGYTDIFVDNDASVVRVQPGDGVEQLLTQTTSPLVLMGKQC